MSPAACRRSARLALANSRTQCRSSASGQGLRKSRWQAPQKVAPPAMTKLLITEITRMGPAFCVIGLQRDGDRIRSIRPVSASANSWLHFPFHRGDVLQCDLAPFVGAKPHIEDRVSTRGFQKEASVPEAKSSLSYARRKSREACRSCSAVFSMKIEAVVDCLRSLLILADPFVGRRQETFASSSVPMNSAPRCPWLRERCCAISPL